MKPKPFPTAQTSFMRRLRTWLLAVTALMAALPMSAQDVTIDMTTGHLLAGLTGSDEIGWNARKQSLWQHNQLPLTFITHDEFTLTASGMPKKHACNVKDINGKMCISAYNSNNTSYFTIALPVGYKFTGYTLRYKANLVDNNEMYTQDNSGSKIYVRHRTAWTVDEIDASQNVLARQDKTCSEESPTEVYTVQRSDAQGQPMGNRLYFRFRGNVGYSSSLAGIELQSIQLFFSSEGNTEVSLAPTREDGHAVAMVQSAMNTSKLNLGPIQRRTRNNVTQMAYYAQDAIRDAVAYNLLYQEDAVDYNGEASANASDHPLITAVKSDYDQKLYYSLKQGTYYIETPVTVAIDGTDDNPVAYRIVGGKLRLHLKPVTYTYYTFATGNLNLGDQGKWTTGSAARWGLDGKKLYAETNQGRVYLTTTGSVYQEGKNVTKHDCIDLAVTADRNSAPDFTIDRDKRLYTQINRTNYYLTSDGAGNGNAAKACDRLLHRIEGKTGTAGKGSYVNVAIYSVDGKTEYRRYGMSSVDGDWGGQRYWDIDFPEGLNNDAVKFGIECPDDGSALVTFTLTLQALSPYVQDMDVVATSSLGGLRMTQKFSTTNFTVGGDHFVFYVPEGYEPENLNFSFENLYSPYGDASYPSRNAAAGPHYARYSFVMSEYQEEIFNRGSGRLYDCPDYVWGDDHTAQKLSVGVSGSKRFEFNNAAELDPASSTADTRYFIERPFSLDAYDYQGGTFDVIHFTKDQVRAGTARQKCYVFTSDETKYNIAPTYATEHRAYAFYEMTIELQEKTYSPKVTLTRLYDHTDYYMEEGRDADGNVTKPAELNADNAMYGLRISAEDTDGQPVDGYLTTDQIDHVLANLHYDVDGQTVELPRAKQVLYLDLSGLTSVVDYQEQVLETDGLTDIRHELNDNALVFMPVGQRHVDDNVVSSTRDGAFMATANIVIKDKQPFFSPYDIVVAPENYATYTRLVSRSDYDQATFASLMLPFTLSIDADGIHTNSDASADRFQMLTMDTSDCLGKGFDGSQLADQKDYAHFVAVSGSTQTDAHRPYVVKLLSASPDDATVSFTALQHGAMVKSTAALPQKVTAESSTGTADGVRYTFTPTATYSGTQIAAGNLTFYFSSNWFRSNETLRQEYSTVYVYPFRGYYATETTGGGTKMTLFGVSDDDSFTGTTAITTPEAARHSALRLAAGHRRLTLTADSDATVTVYTAAGSVAATVTLTAGEPATLALPAGVYVAGAQKVIVR